MNHPKVSVFMMAYNHEKFIEQALESILMQEVNFDYEIVIGEDCSTDSTRQIILGFQEKHPDKFKLLLQNTNIGANQNQFEVFNNCTGKYIAMLEGDDYWTDPLKLQKQIDILENENHIGVIGVITNASKVDKDGSILIKNGFNVVKHNKPGIYNLHDFFQDTHEYPTLSVIFRNIIPDIFTQYQTLENNFFGDWTLWVLLHLRGDFYYLDEITGNYRIHNNSLTHTVNSVKRWKHYFVLAKQLKTILPQEYHKYLRDYSNHYIKIAISYKKKEEYLYSLAYLSKAFVYNPRTFLRVVGRLIKHKLNNN